MDGSARSACRFPGGPTASIWRLLAAEPGELSFAGLVGGSADPRNEWVIREVPADIVVEATFTNLTDGEPALSHVRWALRASP
ncbi:hypothetical protein [Streptomyces viridochromogenes]|uniref:hypothetical protein n=1 Tax=Streptomyces viridochromogenes TaxID=1938 RepID=UPI00031B51C6|nr:hypothetical protein [Streptomyces viridochromogenes]